MAWLRAVGPDSEARRFGDALTELVAERGYAEVELEALLERAGLDRAAFERSFSSLDDCFLAVWEEVDAEFGRRVAAAFDSPAPWRERLRAALDAGLRFLAEDGGRARLYVTDALFAGERVAQGRRRSLARLAAIVDRGREEMSDPERVSPTIAEGLAGGVWHRVVRVVQAGRYAELPEELSDLMYVCVLPYADAEIAKQELRRTA